MHKKGKKSGKKEENENEIESDNRQIKKLEEVRR